jgi:hypothetical protein
MAGSGGGWRRRRTAKGRRGVKEPNWRSHVGFKLRRGRKGSNVLVITGMKGRSSILLALCNAHGPICMPETLTKAEAIRLGAALMASGGLEGRDVHISSNVTQWPAAMKGVTEARKTR